MSEINGLNLYMYCKDNPVMYVDPSGNMPRWAKWLIGGLAVAGLVAATILTFGAAGVAATAIGSAMLTGGLVSTVINIDSQLRSGEPFDWTQLAISTLSGTMYGLVVATTGGTVGWAIAGKLIIAGGTSLLESWNKDLSEAERSESFVKALIFSSVIQVFGYIAKDVGPLFLSKFKSNSSSDLLVLKENLLNLWNDPKIKTGVIKFIGDIFKSFFRRD